MPFHQINHTSYYYELHGQGQPLVLIAGYTMDHVCWLPLLEALSKHFQVCIFDNRGIGQTQDDGSVLTAEIMADDIAAIIKQLNLNKPHIAGQSMGGNIAQLIAGRHPDLISKLILITTTAKWRPAILLTVDTHIRMREANVDSEILLDSIAGFVFGNQFLLDTQKMAVFKNLMRTLPNAQALVDQKRQRNVLVHFDGVSNLQRITASTLVIHANEDILVLAPESEFLVKHIAHAKLIHMDCGHAITMEAPQHLSDAMIYFLQ